jgi:hypothetical protein
MKQGILFMSFAVSPMFGFQSVAQEIISGPAISVNKDVHDYGNIAFAANGECDFVITNNGTEPLIINDARPSCGCNVPQYTKEPIAPGASTTIKVAYDTKRSGSFSKTITFMTNALNDP